MTTTLDQTATTDEVLLEVRQHKHDIAAAYGFDILALGRALQARELSDPRFNHQNTPSDGSSTKGVI